MLLSRCSIYTIIIYILCLIIRFFSQMCLCCQYSVPLLCTCVNCKVPPQATYVRCKISSRLLNDILRRLFRKCYVQRARVPAGSGDSWKFVSNDLVTEARRHRSRTVQQKTAEKSTTKREENNTPTEFISRRLTTNIITIIQFIYVVSKENNTLNCV